MLRPPAAALLLLCLAVACQADDFTAWQDAGSKNGVVLSKRENTRTKLSEYRACGLVDAPVAAVKGVLENVSDAPDFMPYVEEVKVVEREPGKVVFYQRIQPPFVTERDYTLSFVTSSRETPAGPAYRLTWTLANERGPSRKDDAVRVEINEGYWDLEPTDDGKRTRLSYSVYTDIGSGVPGFLVRKGNLIALPRLFDAVRKRVAER